MPCLELEVAESPATAFGGAALELTFEFAQLIERTRSARTGLTRILPPEIVRGAAHLLGDAAHLLRRVALSPLRAGARILAGAGAALTALPRLPLLAGRLPGLAARLSRRTLLPLLPRFAVLSGLLLARLLLQLLGHLLGAVAQVVLLARQAVELALALLRRQLVLAARELLLLAHEFVLTLRQLLDAVDRGSIGVFRLLGAGLVLVVRLLVLRQLLVEQAREVFGGAVLRLAGAGLLPLDLALAYVGLRLEEGIQRLHLVRHRIRRLQRIERVDRLAHRLRRRRHGVFLGRGLTHTRRIRLGRWLRASSGTRAGPIASRVAHGRGAEPARRLFDAHLQLGFRLRHRPDVLLRLRPLRVARAAIELPGGDDDLLLRRHQIIELRVAAAAALRRLCLGQAELLFERLHFEEEDVAARLAGALASRQIAGPHVVADEVARRDVDVLEVHHVPAAHRRRPRRDAERHHRLDAAAHGVDQIERGHTEVVLCFGGNLHFLEPRHAAIAGGTHHVHVRRTIVEDADEILGVTVALHAIGIGQRHAVRAVLGNLQRRRHHGGRLGAERHGLLGPEHHTSGRHRRVGVDRHLYARPLGAVDVAAVFLDACREPKRRRIVVLDVDASDTRRTHHRDVEHRRGGAAGKHFVLERAGERRQRQAEVPGAVGLHVDRLPVGGPDSGAQQLRHNRGGVADEPRFDGEA